MAFIPRRSLLLAVGRFLERNLFWCQYWQTDKTLQAAKTVNTMTPTSTHSSISASISRASALCPPRWPSSCIYFYCELRSVSCSLLWLTLSFVVSFESIPCCWLPGVIFVVSSAVAASGWTGSFGYGGDFSSFSGRWSSFASSSSTSSLSTWSLLSDVDSYASPVSGSLSLIWGSISSSTITSSSTTPSFTIPSSTTSSFASSSTVKVWF